MSQVVETVADTGFDVASITATRLLSAEMHNGLLYGPRSPKYNQKNVAETQQQ